MNCDNCKGKPAAVHITKVVNGEKVEANLCEQCAKETGGFVGFMGMMQGSEPFGFAVPSFNLGNLLSGILQTDNTPREQDQDPGKRCECGFTYPDFAKYGRLGCGKCYTTFEDRIGPLLRRVHGSTAHTGKVPTRTSGNIRLKRNLEELRQVLQKHIGEEKYEEAAKVRDQIRALEKEIGG